MCDPVSLTALALSAGGTFLESREQQKNAKRAMNAKNDAFQQHTDRQNQFADETGQAFGDNTRQQGREAFDEKKEEDIVARKQAFGNIRTTPDYNMGAPTSAPKNVVLSRQAASDEASAETDRDVDASSRLSGYGGSLFDQDLDRNKFVRLFGGIQDKAGRDTKMLPLDMQAAATNSQKGQSMLPQLMKLAGAGMGMYGAAGAPGLSMGKQGVAFGGSPHSLSAGGKIIPGVKPNFIKYPSMFTGR